MGVAGSMVGLAIGGTLAYKIMKKAKVMKGVNKLVKDLNKKAKEELK